LVIIYKLMSKIPFLNPEILLILDKLMVNSSF